MTVENNGLLKQTLVHMSSVSEFIAAVRKNELRKRSEVLKGLDAVELTARNFISGLKSYPGYRDQNKAQYSAMRKDAQELVKIVTAVRNGLMNGETNLTKFRALVKSRVLPLHKNFTQHAHTLELPFGFSESEFMAEFKHSVRDSTSIKDVTALLQHAAENSGKQDAASEELSLREDSLQIQKYTKFKSKLPTSLKGKLFQAITIPIVPLISSDFHVLMPKFLRRSGLKFQAFGESFVVFEDQVLLAFDTTKTAEPDLLSEKPKKDRSNKKSFETQGLKSRKLSTAKQLQHEGFLLDVINRINESSSVQYVLMSTHFEYGTTSSKIAYAWLMPKSVYNMFARNANLSKMTWGFPWTMAEHSVL